VEQAFPIPQYRSSSVLPAVGAKPQEPSPDVPIRLQKRRSGEKKKCPILKKPKNPKEKGMGMKIKTSKGGPESKRCSPRAFGQKKKEGGFLKKKKNLTGGIHPRPFG